MIKSMNHFMDMEEELRRPDTARYVLLTVPYDGTSTFVKGADKGPQAILDASDSLELYDVQYGVEACRAGIYTDHYVYDFSSPETMVQGVYQRTRHFLQQGRRVTMVGGEHSVSIGAIQAVSEQFEELTVLQFDAHADLREEYQGSIYNHACVMRRAQAYARVVQVGIRSVCTEEQSHLVPENVFYAHQIYNCEDWMEQALQRLTDKVYISFDLDGFDPSILPATGTPLPGGLAWYPTLKFLDKVFRSRHVVGLDIVELCPQEGNYASNVLAASLLYKMITMWEVLRPER